MNNITNKLKRTVSAIVLAAILVFAQNPMPAQAAQITNLNQLDEARVSFTFDDGFASTRTLAAPILEARGIDGVLYLTSGTADGTTPLDAGLPAITWDQVRELQNVYGWEIGGHTETHPEMPTISESQNEAELVNSNTAFQANGLNVTNFASPFGAYDNATVTEILKYYKSHRGFQDRDALNVTPYNKAVLMVQDVNETTTPAQVQAWVDQAIAEKRWLILVFHHTAPQTNPNYEYTVTTANLTTMANYVQSRVAAGQIKVVTVEQGITIPGTNVIQDSGFTTGLTGNWITDNTNVVKADNNNNGNYGSPVQSISMTGTATTGHLFSNLTPVSTTSSYVLDVFVNATDLTGGELGFYIDEYDVNNNWVSGQWLGMVQNGTIGFFTALYNATSNLVSSVRVQTYLTAGATGTAYIDSVNLNNLDGTPTPSPTATPTATPTPPASGSNLVVNNSFNNGSTDGWSTDNPENVAVITDGTEYSIWMKGNTLAAHLFSDAININPLTNFVFNVTADTTALTNGELGFYIDEYDASGTWISGQWIGAAINNTLAMYEAVYVATSNLVNSISLQTYLTAGATGDAVVDDYALYDQNAPTATPTVVPTGTITPTPTATPAATNMITNGSFEDGLTGWTTDNAANVTADANAGKNSVKLNGNAAGTHLFQGLIAVDPAVSYLFKLSADATNLTSGELGYYIDEYNAAGTWISGQWFGKATNGVVNTFERAYKATSNLVNSIRVQTYLTAGAVGSAFVDDYSLTDSTAATPTTAPTGTVTPIPTGTVTPTVEPTATPSGTVTPTPTETVTPTPTTAPTGTNLVPNSSFETVTGGFADSWTRDTSDFVIDTTSNGNDGVNSLHMAPNTAYAHAFSNLIAVDSAKTYTWTQFVSALAGTGEFGFYIDEYDALGNWISGQWKGMVSGAFTGTQSFSYVPTSAQVSQVRLQYYTTPNSTFNLYIDSVNLSN